MCCRYCQVTALLNSAQNKSCTWLLHQSKRTEYYNNPREGETGRAGLQTQRKQQQGSEVRTRRCCLDNKSRICAQNKGEVEDSGATQPEQHPALSRLGFTPGGLQVQDFWMELQTCRRRLAFTKRLGNRSVPRRRVRICRYQYRRTSNQT